jgi:hypothetical protein
MLTMMEQSELARHEATIERGLATFVDVGQALFAIRDGRLYRLDYGTFEDYCRERWGFTGERARLLMRSAEVVNHLAETPTMVGVLPTTERHVRPLTSLQPDQQPVAWQRAVETLPEGERMTAAHVSRVVRSMTEGEADDCIKAEREPPDQADAQEAPAADPSFTEQFGKALTTVAAANPAVRAANAAAAFSRWGMANKALIQWEPEEMAAALPPDDLFVSVVVPELEDWLARFHRARKGPRLLKGATQ